MVLFKIQAVQGANTDKWPGKYYILEVHLLIESCIFICYIMVHKNAFISVPHMMKLLSSVYSCQDWIIL